MVGTDENRSGAEPTGWSAALDQICSGADTVDEGPAQAWSVLTVGGTTLTSDIADGPDRNRPFTR